MPRAAVLGSPVRHSLSPALHRAAYDALGLRDWHYEALECDEAALPALLDGLDEQWAGVSLTMPLKRAVIPLLDEVSDLAARVDAVNTVVLSPGGLSSGHRRGENTDVYGIATVLAEAGLPALDPAADVAVLGAGATAGSALAALSGLGARAVRVHVRDAGRAGQVLRAAERLGVEVDLRRWPAPEDLAALAGSGGVLLSTVPTGAADRLAAGLDRVVASTGGGVREAVGPGLLLDVVYAPWPTPLAAAWRRHGGRVVGGLEMLVHQAVEQVELFTGLRPAPEVLRAAGERELARRSAGS